MSLLRTLWDYTCTENPERQAWSSCNSERQPRVRDYMSRYDTGLDVTVRKANLGKRVPLKDNVKIKSIWNFIEAAARSGTYLRQALIVKKHDESKDLHCLQQKHSSRHSGPSLYTLYYGLNPQNPKL